jgi:microcystin-dependent protein
MAFSAFSTNPSVLTQTVGGPVIEKVYSVSSGHTFSLGEGVYLNASGQLSKARADSLSTSFTIGVVKGIDTTTVTVGYQGEFSVDAATTGNFPLVTGSVYYLSPSLDGGLTTVSPVNSSQIVQPLLVAKDSYSAIIVNSLPRQNYGFTSLFTPVGTLVPYGGRADNIPSNWLLCAGDALAKGATNTDPYYDLYSAIGEKYFINGFAQSGSTGTYAYINFDGSVENAPAFGTGLPGSTKNHSLTGNDVYKITWGTKQAVASVYSAVGTTSIVVFEFLSGITGATNAFTGLVEATEVNIKSLVAGEAAGYTSDKFFLPDLRGRMAIGAGRGVGLTNRTVGAMGGEETHTLTLSEIPSHRHNIGLRNSESISGSANYYLGGVSGGSVNAVLSTDLQTNSAVSDLTGGGNAHENMPPFISTNWIIRYKDNRGLPGIETGPKGDQGVQGVQGNTGPTGVQGATGVTGYASGTISYRYTGIPTPPNGYWTENVGATGYLTVSSLEDSNVNISSYLETWDDSNNPTLKGVVFIRDAYNSPSFFRIYHVTGEPLTGDTSGVVYYKFPVTSVVASGTGNSGQAYNFMFVRSADNGSNGVNGVTGDKGDSGVAGAKGETGAQGATGIDGTCGCPVFSASQEIQFYVDPDSTMQNSSLLSYSPYNFSGAASQPTSFTYFKNSLLVNSEIGYDEFSELRYPVPVNADNIIKYNFNYSITGGTPCDEGNCIGATSYYNFVNSVRLGDSSVPPTQMSMVLSSNKTYRFDNPVVIKDCAFGIYAQSGSYFSKIPTGLSASFDSSVTGSTGRNYLNIDVYADTNNVAVGNYIALKSEYFGLTSAASATGYQTLCGIYRVNAVDYVNDVISVQGRVLGGATGSRMFTGSLTYPDISTVDIYTTVVEFRNSSGFFVEPTASLMLGKTTVGSTGDPFVIIHSGGLTSHNYAKGVHVSGGKAYLGNSMALYSWPEYGAALYATNSGLIRGEGLVGSNNGTFAYADSSSRIILSYPILTSNNEVFVVDGGKIFVSGTTASSGNKRFIAANNETVALILNAGSVDIADTRPQIITDGIQSGFLANRAAFSIRGISGSDGAFIGATGIIGTRGISLNGSSSGLIELDNVTIRSSVTGNSSLGVTKRIGQITSVYSSTAPIVAGGGFGGDERYPSAIPPILETYGEE